MRAAALGDSDAADAVTRLKKYPGTGEGELGEEESDEIVL